STADDANSEIIDNENANNNNESKVIITNNHTSEKNIIAKNTANLEGDIGVDVKKDFNITNITGSGEQAKTSTIWYVISFVLTLYACVLTFILVIDVLSTGGENILTYTKESWAVFTPIITLSLGYLFGKKDESTKSKVE
ncbi:hypothetical protein, partial [Serratia marcescens]